MVRVLRRGRQAKIREATFGDAERKVALERQRPAQGPARGNGREHVSERRLQKRLPQGAHHDGRAGKRRRSRPHWVDGFEPAGLRAQNPDRRLVSAAAARCLRTIVRQRGSWRERSTPTRTRSNGRSPIPASRRSLIGAHFHGPVSYLGLTAGGKRAHSGRNAGQSREPVPRAWPRSDDDQAKDLKDGRWYFNLHSKLFPAGEIRGPVIRR